MDSLYTTHDISRMLQVDPSTVSKWVDRGMLLAFRTPGGHRRVRSGDLRNFLIAHQMPIPQEIGSDLIRLLVVDDEKPVLDAIKRQFKAVADQVEISTTTSGVEAVLLVAETRPHGVLIDLNMPDLDGYEVVRRIHSRPQFEGVKLLTMTGRHSAEVIEEAKKAGAAACLAKPVKLEEVLEFFKVPMALAASGRR